mgnify:FL=1
MALTHTLSSLLLPATGLLSCCTAMLDFAQAIVYKRTLFIFPKVELFALSLIVPWQTLAR